MWKLEISTLWTKYSHNRHIWICNQTDLLICQIIKQLILGNIQSVYNVFMQNCITIRCNGNLKCIHVTIKGCKYATPALISGWSLFSVTRGYDAGTDANAKQYGTTARYVTPWILRAHELNLSYIETWEISTNWVKDQYRQSRILTKFLVQNGTLL